MAKRKSGKELRAEYKELLDKTKAMQNYFVKRAKELIKLYPDVPFMILRHRNNEILTIGQFSKLSQITPQNGLDIIEEVEKYLQEQHPHKQTKIDFDVQN